MGALIIANSIVHLRKSRLTPPARACFHTLHINLYVLSRDMRDPNTNWKKTTLFRLEIKVYLLTKLVLQRCHRKLIDKAPTALYTYTTLLESLCL